MPLAMFEYLFRSEIGRVLGISSARIFMIDYVFPPEPPDQGWVSFDIDAAGDNANVMKGYVHALTWYVQQISETKYSRNCEKVSSEQHSALLGHYHA